MKIIDSHLHFCPGYPHFDEIAIEAGHINNEEHLRECFQKYNIVGGIVMGNRGVHPDNHTYPDFLRYCVGVEARKLTPEKIQKTCDLVEENLKRNTCVGIKLYPGYDSIYVTDERFEPIYDLAKAYKKPVAIHTGQTAGSKAFIKYSHPLTLDEAAVRHPDVQFVMCHFGNPWLMDAAAVVEKNENVAADLSGLLEGKFDIPEFLEEQSGYISTLKTWLAYIRDYDKLMFGTDWPLANYEDYIEITKRLIPENTGKLCSIRRRSGFIIAIFNGFLEIIALLNHKKDTENGLFQAVPSIFFISKHHSFPAPVTSKNTSATLSIPRYAYGSSSIKYTTEYCPFASQTRWNRNPPINTIPGSSIPHLSGSPRSCLSQTVSIPCFFTAFTVFSAFSAFILFSHVRFIRTCLLRLPLALIPAITHTHAIAYTNVCTRFAAKT